MSLKKKKKRCLFFTGRSIFSVKCSGRIFLLLYLYCFTVSHLIIVLHFFLSDKDQSKEKEKKVKKTIPAWATLSASQLARAQKQTQMAATSRPKMDAILTEAIKVSRSQVFLCSPVTKQKDITTIYGFSFLMVQAIVLLS